MTFAVSASLMFFVKITFFDNLEYIFFKLLNLKSYGYAKILLIFFNSWLLSPGLTLSGLYPTKKSVPSFNLFFFF